MFNKNSPLNVLIVTFNTYYQSCNVWFGYVQVDLIQSFQRRIVLGSA